MTGFVVQGHKSVFEWIHFLSNSQKSQSVINLRNVDMCITAQFVSQNFD